MKTFTFQLETDLSGCLLSLFVLCLWLASKLATNNVSVQSCGDVHACSVHQCIVVDVVVAVFGSYCVVLDGTASRTTNNYFAVFRAGVYFDSGHP